MLIFTASGSGAFESAVVNLLSPGERVLVVSAGEFGERWAALATAYGADVQDLRYAWGETPRPEDVAHASRRPAPRSSSSCTRRRRPASSPTSRRLGRRLEQRERSRRRRRVQPGCGAARDRRVGPRCRRRRLAEGAYDPTRALARDRVAERVGTVREDDDPALLLRLGEAPRVARDGDDSLHARRLPHRLSRRGTRNAARRGARGRLCPARCAREGVPRRREGDGPGAVLSRRGALGGRHCDPDARRGRRAGARPRAQGSLRHHGGRGARGPRLADVPHRPHRLLRRLRHHDRPRRGRAAPRRGAEPTSSPGSR